MSTAKAKAEEWVTENGVRVAAAAAAPIPVPGAHTALCTAIEAYMIYSVAQIYGRELTTGEAVAMIPALGAGMLVTKAVSSIIGETVGWIPFAGWAVKGVVSGGAAYAIGMAAVGHFEQLHPGREAAPFEMLQVKEFVVRVFRQLGLFK